jgi:hypothetical protein
MMKGTVITDTNTVLTRVQRIARPSMRSMDQLSKQSKKAAKAMDDINTTRMRFEEMMTERT